MSKKAAVSKKAAATKKAAASKKAAKAPQQDTDQLVYRINTLLHTMRAIERHEDSLCALMTEVKTSGRVTAILDEELRDILEQMPAHEYNDDIEAVREALTPARLGSK